MWYHNNNHLSQLTGKNTLIQDILKEKFVSLQDKGVSN